MTTVVSFVLSPEISAVVGAGEEVLGCGPIKRMIQRRLDTAISAHEPKHLF